MNDVITYDVILNSDDTVHDISALGYYVETLENILGYNRELSIKLIKDMVHNHKSLIFTSPTMSKSVTVRDSLLACGLNCTIIPVTDSVVKR